MRIKNSLKEGNNMTTTEKIKEMIEAKCSIPDCGKKQFVSSQIGNLILPFCEEHFNKLMFEKPKWHTINKKVMEMLSKSKGEVVEIKTWEEFKEKVKPEFLAVATQGLELTKGKCLGCGRKAVGIVTFCRPVCERCMEFPRMVDKVALKEEQLSYIG